MNDIFLSPIPRSELEVLIENSVRKIIIEYLPKDPLQDKEELLTVKQAADFLSLSVQTIYGAIHRKQLPYMKRRKRCYFLKKDLIDYLKAGRRKTSVEIESEAQKFINDRKGSLK
jgi:excisionase family DNA binding protein